LRRVNKEILASLEDVFQSHYQIEYSEILFSPEFKLTLGGREGSFLGGIDARLTGSGDLRKLLARQCSFCIRK